MEDLVDYGPLAAFVGVWEGNKGLDISPEEDGTEERNPYFETITITEAGDLKNAGKQHLVMLAYHQVVTRKSNNQVFHDEVGYLIWDEERNTMIRSYTIPRAVAVVAGGTFTKSDDGKTTIEVSAALEGSDWDIAQSPYMKENAKTTAFESKMVVEGDRMDFYQKMTLEIYGKTFDHTDDSVLRRVS